MLASFFVYPGKVGDFFCGGSSCCESCWMSSRDEVEPLKATALIVSDCVNVSGAKVVKGGIDSKDGLCCACFCGRLSTDCLAVRLRGAEDVNECDDLDEALCCRGARRPPPGCAFTLREEEATN